MNAQLGDFEAVATLSSCLTLCPLNLYQRNLERINKTHSTVIAPTLYCFIAKLECRTARQSRWHELCQDDLTVNLIRILSGRDGVNWLDLGFGDGKPQGYCRPLTVCLISGATGFEQRIATTSTSPLSEKVIIT